MKFESGIRDVFLRLVIFFLAFGWLVLLFSIIGLFYRETVILSIIASLAIFLYISQKRKFGDANHFEKTAIFVFFIALAVSFVTCYYATPTVFGGRDQGSISTAAIYLSENHKVEIENPIVRDLFQKYGPGKALNYPGFDYTKSGNLVSRFPLGYTSYLSSVYSLFGLKGIQYANFIPLFLFLALFWLTLREFFSEKKSLFGFLVAATFFPFLWFAKYTLTETYALFLTWAGIYFLVSAFRNPISKNPEVERLKIIFALAAFGLSALVRIEGIVFFLLAAVYVFALSGKKALALSKNFKKYLAVSAVFLLVAYAFLNFPALSDSAKNIAKTFLSSADKDSVLSENLYLHLLKVFFNYNILVYLLLGLLGIGWLIKDNRKNWSNPEFIPILITLPTFFYLVSPMISLDDPWMLRRFSFAVFPALIFYLVYFLSRFFHYKKFLYIFFGALIAANIGLSYRYITISENKNLLPEIKEISKKFGPSDLILVDRLATDSGWSLMSEPMSAIYGKNAVYFFNADDLEAIGKSRYEHIYLIAQEADKNSWYSGLVSGKPFSKIILENNYLEPSDGFLKLATNINSTFYVNIWKIK